MIDLTNINQIKGLQSNMHVVFDSPPGKEVLAFLEQICGWYDVGDTETEIVLNKNGKRQVLATIKTLLELTPEQVRQLTI